MTLSHSNPLLTPLLSTVAPRSVHREQPALRLLTPRQLAEYRQTGFVVLARLFPEQTLDDCIAELDLWMSSGEEFNGATFLRHATTRSPLLRRFVEHPLLHDLSADLVGPGARLHWEQAVYKSPGAASFPLHQDSGYRSASDAPYLTCWLALTGASEQAGCLWVLPGAHVSGLRQHRPTPLGLTCLAADAQHPAAVSGLVPLPVAAGSVIALSSLTPHASGANDTESLRKAYVIQFAAAGT